jgi:FkbM family methyltransferase
MIHAMRDHQDQAGAWDVLCAARGRLAFDIGANIGQSTAVLAARFEQVVALEPCTESYEILAAEMPANVFCLQQAASDHSGVISLVEAERSIGTGQLVTAGPSLPYWGDTVGTREVEATTVDSLTRLFGPPDFCKIDTEGHEIPVLEGAIETVRKHHPQIIVEVHHATHDAGVRKLLDGYDLVELRHGSYVRQGGEVWQNHFWLHGGWNG